MKGTAINMSNINKKELHEIFQGIYNKNEEKFNLFYEKYNNLVYSIAFSILKNKENSEDVVQNVYAKIWNMDKNKLPKECEASWIYSLTKNETLNYIRSKKQEIDIEEIYYLSVEDDEILLSAIFKLKKEKKSKILNEMMEIFQKRKTLQPYNYPSAGSVFKRGENFLPAKLIDEWGLKGLKVGGACVSDKHAGFIINIKNASSNDVKKLIEEIERNASQHGFVFEKEIKVLK